MHRICFRITGYVKLFGKANIQSAQTLPELSLHGTEYTTRKTTPHPHPQFFLPSPLNSRCLLLLVFFTQTSNFRLHTWTVNALKPPRGRESAALSYKNCTVYRLNLGSYQRLERVREFSDSISLL